MKTTEKIKRNLEIVNRHLDGMNFADLAREYDISRERVRQIVRKKGIPPSLSREAVSNNGTEYELVPTEKEK